MPVLNVSSRVTWLQLDDKGLLESHAVLQEGILLMFSRKRVSGAWQGAHGSSPSCCLAVRWPGVWLDFMLSQRNLWPTFTTGCFITNANVRHWSRTLKAFCMHFGQGRGG